MTQRFRLRCNTCFACLFCLILLPSFAWGQFEKSDRKVEFRTNPISDGLLNFNLGLRFQTKYRWKPDVSLAFHFPITTLIPKVTELQISAMPLFLGVYGHGFSLYGGLTWMRPPRTGKWSDRFSAQIGLKAHQTGLYSYEYFSICGSQDEQRITFGARGMFSAFHAVTNRFGLEFFAGLGLRAGVHRLKVHNDGSPENGCHDYDYLEGLPQDDFGNWRTSIVPTYHTGLALVFW